MENSKDAEAAAAKPQAVKWFGMGRPSGDGNNAHNANEVMFVHPEAAKQVLLPMGNQPVNLISIFGAARQGKSFLMNLLSDEEDQFKISNLREPCTQGVDLSGQFIPLPVFSELNGCPRIEDDKSADETLHIGFVDAEGQGDRDITYDSCLVSPVLLSSKVVLFNWKDSLQADRMLNLLAVLARAAQGIELADDDESKVFGHLHIVFRDWSFVDSSPEEVFKDLFTKEKGRSAEVNVRNLARVNLLEAFESITVWLFPAPVANTANLKDKIRFEQLQAGFQEKLRDLRKSLSNQLQHPMKFGGKPLTARLLSQMMPALVDTLNSDEVIMPESIYSSLVRAEAKATKDECEKSIEAYCEAACAEEMTSSVQLEKSLKHDVERRITEALEKMKGAPLSVQKEMRDALEDFASKEIRLVLQSNNDKIAEAMSKEVDLIFKNLKEECAIIEKDGIPMRNDLLRHRCADILALEVNRLEVLPLGALGQDGVDVEINRVKEHASAIFDKLEATNDKAIQKANAVMHEMVRTGKSRMTKDMHETLDKIFSVRTPTTIVTLQAGLEAQYRDLLKELNSFVAENPFISVNFDEDVEQHKSHVADELNRRYSLEVRPILSEVGFTSKEDLAKELAMRLDDNLPVHEDEVKQAIDEAVNLMAHNLRKELEGWTLLMADVSAKTMELEKLGNMYKNDYLRRNQMLQAEASARQEKQQYEDLRAQVIEKFHGELKALDFPTTEAEIDSVYSSTLEATIAEFLSLETTSANFNKTMLFGKLRGDCQADLDNQQKFNSLAIEKSRALSLAAEERKLREQETLVVQIKEEEINELKSTLQKALAERDAESKRLHEQLRNETERAEELHGQVDSLRLQTQIQAEQLALSYTESRVLAQEVDEMRQRAAQLEGQKFDLERFAMGRRAL